MVSGTTPENIHTLAMVSLIASDRPVPETLLMDTARIRELRREFVATVSVAAQMVVADYAMKEPGPVLALLARGESFEALLAALPDKDTITRALAKCTEPTDAVWGLM